MFFWVSFNFSEYGTDFVAKFEGINPACCWGINVGVALVCSRLSLSPYMEGSRIVRLHPRLILMCSYISGVCITFAFDVCICLLTSCMLQLEWQLQTPQQTKLRFSLNFHQIWFDDFPPMNVCLWIRLFGGEAGIKSMVSYPQFVLSTQFNIE